MDSAVVAKCVLFLLTWSIVQAAYASAEGGCQDGEFVFGGECGECDENCLPGQCVDDEGCKECANGFHTVVTSSKERRCSRCTIDGCSLCLDGTGASAPKICEECDTGFVPTAGGTACVRSNGTYSKCGEGYYLKQGAKCRMCDRDCGVGFCTDVVGCSKCAAGYYGYREDIYWPFMCLPCRLSIDNCSVCERMDELGKRTSCKECEEGFTLSEDGVSCEPDSKRVTRTTRRSGDDVVSTRKSSFVIDRTTERTTFTRLPDSVTVLRKTFRETECEPHQFRKGGSSGMCMDCDPKCGEGRCKDVHGCVECVSGYYTTREDYLWPFECARCKDKIPNCARCQDGMMDMFPVPCRECEEGYKWTMNGFACVKEP